MSLFNFAPLKLKIKNVLSIGYLIISFTKMYYILLHFKVIGAFKKNLIFNFELK